MKVKRIVLGLMLILTALSLSAVALQQEQAALANKLIRMHVVANSDSAEDQAMKLQVRDAVLRLVEPKLRDADDPERVLSEMLPQISVAAKEVLPLDCDVAVSLEREHFPTRVYDSFSLPPGVYRALRITIGEGKGQNWWCVVFPSICLPAVSDMEKAAVQAGLTEQEVRLITEDHAGYTIKFKLLEWLQQLQAQIG